MKESEWCSNTQTHQKIHSKVIVVVIIIIIIIIMRNKHTHTYTLGRVNDVLTYSHITKFTQKQGSRFRTVPSGTVGIYRTGKQTGIYYPPISYRKKCWPISNNTDRTGRHKKNFFFFFFFLSFVIFEFLLG